MRISKIEINNYRLLKSFSMDLERELSLVIGKNNTGKTSVLSALDKFLTFSEKNRFTFDDFNIDFKKDLKSIIETKDELEESIFDHFGMDLKLYIEYNEEDDLSNISRVMTDLDPGNNTIVLGFSYELSFVELLRLRNDFEKFSSKENIKLQDNSIYIPKTLNDFIRKNHRDYFSIIRKSYEYDYTSNGIILNKYINLTKEEINTKDIINFKFISAKRNVNNKEVDKTLSKQTSEIYKQADSTDEENKAIESFKDRLAESDTYLSDIYKLLFKDITEKIKDFGGVRINESEIEIVSNLQHRELLEGNTTVVYRHDSDNQLPEHYNGLGYMNLISMIFEIEILVHEFRREKGKRPADINLLFIEEPEAHTHPQMQYIFINNIKKLLKDGIVLNGEGKIWDLQSIISTHSSNIVADSDFDDIKYLKKVNGNSVIAKNLKDLKKEYEVNSPQYEFLRQYLTISRAEIFFADKAILIEGDTERILVPTLMKKVDMEEKEKYLAQEKKDEFLQLLSQNISVIEVGAYSQIFEKFIDFLGIRTLIITDLDTVDAKKKECRVNDGVDYSNSAIRFFFKDQSLANLKKYNLSDKFFNKINGVWENKPDGNLCVSYQIEEDGYLARSFEDAFIHLNRDFITKKKETFQGLKNIKYFDDTKNDSYDLADKCVKKKTHFALDILYNSNCDFSNWRIPEYIREGLLWLKQDPH
ncbi:ATP-dependent nuclease [Leptospira sp. 'Mane']|uniref:ATP-dependent nuclease n=1 Tax=Leptospira sp. 'Mane' TaxID=3387407 RepID=UPI00398ADCD7